MVSALIIIESLKVLAVIMMVNVTTNTIILVFIMRGVQNMTMIQTLIFNEILI